VDYADYRVGFICMDPCELFVEGEQVMTKLDSNMNKGLGSWSRSQSAPHPTTLVKR
jgi:hypothetical protein